MQEKQFLVFKKSMRKHIFETPNVFFLYIKKSVQNMLGYWPYATHKKIFYLFFFCENANITIRHTPKWKVASLHSYYKKLETIRNKNRSKPNQLKILYTGKD